MMINRLRTFKAFWLFEYKRFIDNKYLLSSLLVLSIVALAFVQIGVLQYKSHLKQKEIFQQFERTKVKGFINYTQYGTYGYRTLFVPDAISIFFFNTAVIQDMTAYVDSGERLKIYQPMIGKNIFKTKNFGFSDFSGIVLFFGSLITILYLFDAFRNREFLKTLVSIAGPRRVFVFVVMIRHFLRGGQESVDKVTRVLFFFCLGEVNDFINCRYGLMKLRSSTVRMYVLS